MIYCRECGKLLDQSQSWDGWVIVYGDPMFNSAIPFPQMMVKCPDHVTDLDRQKQVTWKFWHQFESRLCAGLFYLDTSEVSHTVRTVIPYNNAYGYYMVNMEIDRSIVGEMPSDAFLSLLADEKGPEHVMHYAKPYQTSLSLLLAMLRIAPLSNWTYRRLT